MKVRLKTSRAGHRTFQGSDGKPVVQAFAQSIGDEIDVDPAEGKRMVERGQAEEISNRQGSDKR